MIALAKRTDTKPANTRSRDREITFIMTRKFLALRRGHNVIYDFTGLLRRQCGLRYGRNAAIDFETWCHTCCDKHVRGILVYHQFQQ